MKTEMQLSDVIWRHDSTWFQDFSVWIVNIVFQYKKVNTKWLNYLSETAEEDGGKVMIGTPPPPFFFFRHICSVVIEFRDSQSICIFSIHWSCLIRQASLYLKLNKDYLAQGIWKWDSFIHGSVLQTHPKCAARQKGRKWEGREEWR